MTYSFQVGSTQSGAAYNQATNGGVSFSVSKPAGVVQNDLLIAVAWGFESSQPSLPSGFTLIDSLGVSPSNWSFQSWYLYIGYKIATASEPTTYSFSGTQGNTGLSIGYGVFGIITAWRGSTRGLVVESHGTQSVNSATNPTTLTVTIGRNAWGRIFVAGLGSAGVPNPSPTLDSVLLNGQTSNPYSSANAYYMFGTSAGKLGSLSESITMSGGAVTNEGYALEVAKMYEPDPIFSD